MLPSRKKKQKKESNSNKHLTDAINNMVDDIEDLDPKQLKQPAKEYYAPGEFFPAKNAALLFTSNDLHLVPCNVYDNGELTYEVPNHLQNTVSFSEVFKGERQKRAIIFRDPHVFRIPYRTTMPTWFGRRLAPEYMTFLVYCINPKTNVTFDPSIDKDEIDPEIAAKFQSLLTLKAAMTKVDWKANLTKGMEEEKNWKDYLWPIMMMIQAVIFLVFFVLAPMWWGG